MYCPVLEMDPAPALASPPLTVQLTVAALPLKVAENCSTDPPELLVALHPVQLVSIVVDPGVTASVDDVPVADPPQPASSTNIGMVPPASARAGQRRSSFNPGRRKQLSPSLLRESKLGLSGSVVTAVPMLNFPGAFLANCPAQFLLDVARSFC